MHRMPRRDRRPGEREARIGDKRRPGLGDIGHRPPLPERGEEPGADGGPVVVVVGHERPRAQRDAVQLHELARRPRVLGRDHVGAGQSVERAQRDVARRADRRRDEMEPRRHRMAPGGHRPAPSAAIYTVPASA
jgi:hypothetical protein